MSSNSTFTMENGNISGNTTAGSGGGVYVGDDATFTMNSGNISGNRASSYGGGVYTVGTKFTKKGGTIYGYDGSSNSNAVKDDSDNVLDNKGHAVYVNTNPEKYRETTAGPSVLLYGTVYAAPGGWEN